VLGVASSFKGFNNTYLPLLQYPSRLASHTKTYVSSGWNGNLSVNCVLVVSYAMEISVIACAECELPLVSMNLDFYILLRRKKGSTVDDDRPFFVLKQFFGSIHGRSIPRRRECSD
jgi:hypothetical protein